MRDIKFRAWDKKHKEMIPALLCFYKDGSISHNNHFNSDTPPFRGYMWNSHDLEIMQYTGLLDKHGVEIYEHMEIDDTYEVSFLNGNYVLTNISNGDVMLLSNYMENNNGKIEITREYTKI